MKYGNGAPSRKVNFLVGWVQSIFKARIDAVVARQLLESPEDKPRDRHGRRKWAWKKTRRELPKGFPGAKLQRKAILGQLTIRQG